jgi:TatA/E family protein of Tat protein translocase
MFGNPMEIALLVGAAVLLFGADKIPKLAKSVGSAKKEFMIGQAEADVAADRVREDARRQAEANHLTHAGIPAGEHPADSTIPSATNAMDTPPIRPV